MSQKIASASLPPVRKRFDYFELFVTLF